MIDDADGGDGLRARMPPPKEFRFLPGQSGFPQGKRKGTVSRTRLTRKVALRRHRVRLEAKLQSRTLLALVLLKVRAMAMAGHPSAATLLEWVREQIQPGASAPEGELLIVPERASSIEELEEAFAAYAAAHPYEPGSEEWYRVNQPSSAARSKIDPTSPVGIAMEEFKEKWGYSPF